MSDLLRINEAAKLLEKTPRALKWAVREGSVKAFRDAKGHLLFEREEILRWKNTKGKGHRGREYIEYPPLLDKEGWDEQRKLQAPPDSHQERGGIFDLDYGSLLQLPSEERYCDAEDLREY